MFTIPVTCEIKIGDQNIDCYFERTWKDVKATNGLGTYVEDDMARDVEIGLGNHWVEVNSLPLYWREDILNEAD